LALAIAHEVSGRLTPAQETRLASNRTTNPRAYDAYLRGRHLWDQRTEEPVAEAVGYFEQALREDPKFALAYSGLADCYSVGWWSKADWGLAEEYARKALTLEPDMAEGHASLGAVDWQRLKWAEGVKECKRAIELNPNYAMAHHFYAIHLLCLGQLGEALAENNRALQLDPFSLPVNTVRQYILSGLRQYDRAVEQCEATVAMNPQLHFPHGCRARFYWIEGRVPEALADERKAATLARLPARLYELDEIAAAYAQSGPRAAKLKLAQQLEEKYHKGESLPLDIACAYGVLGDKGRVVKWLNQSFRDRNDDFTMMLKSAPEFDFVRSDPRFQDLLRRMNFPP
jgi:tetratricopeptide (TPR) repeat protein